MIAAWDTSGAVIVAAVRHTDGSWRHAVREGRGQQVLALVRELMAGEPLEHLQAIVCCTGPGSFTGTRIGVATAWGLARGLRGRGGEVSLHGVSSLEVRAWLLEGSAGPTDIAVDARRDELFVQAFERAGEKGPSACGPLRVVAAAAHPDLVRAAAVPPDPEGLARAAAHAVDALTGLDPMPMYGREPDAKPATGAAR